MCVFLPQLEDWVGKDVVQHRRDCTNRIYDAVNPAGSVHNLNSQQIMTRIGLMSDNGGFEAPVRRRIAEFLMFRNMMWAFDLVEMEKNNYKHFVPRDRYRFARALGIVPRNRIPIEFDIIAKHGRNRGQRQDRGRVLWTSSRGRRATK